MQCFERNFVVIVMKDKIGCNKVLTLFELCRFSDNGRQYPKNRRQYPNTQYMTELPRVRNANYKILVHLNTYLYTLSVVTAG